MPTSTTNKSEINIQQEDVVVEKKRATTKERAAEQQKPIVPKDIDPNQFIVVRNGFQGKLIYISRTGERFVWDEFGSEQELELRELRNAKSSAKAYYEKNWFMFDDENQWVIDYLGLRQFYKNVLKIEDFDNLFTKAPAEVEKIVSKLSKGQKRSVEYKARTMIKDGEIDSLKVIAALEKALNTELIEK